MKITEFLSNLEYPLWDYIVEILCIGGIALGVLFLFYEIYKGITETNERIRQADEVPSYVKVRKWDDVDWHEPTVDYMSIE